MHDAALIEASRSGDRSAFGQIVERYQRAVYAVSFAQLRDRALSDDITQDTFVTAWRRLGELRDTTRLPAWLCGIARNHARDARKRRHREHGDAAGELVDLATPFDALSDAESEQLINVALADVPDVYREALVLFYYEQHSVDDVARALGITPHTTNKRLSRGRQHLAARVEALLDSRLTRRGPRRDLAVCVLAAIGLLGSAAYADAAPAVTKGSTMLKLALATTVVATVGGASLLAARPTTHARTTPSPQPAATTSAARPATRAPSPPSLSVSTGDRVVPDCGAVARHMAELQVEALDRGHHFSHDKREQFVALRSPELARHCTTEHWPDERRICVMGADDSDSARVDCVEGIVATSGELADLPRELRCDLVAKHQVELMSAPDGKLAAFVKPGAHVELERLAAELATQVTGECERIPWSLAVRRCILASKAQRDLHGCM